MGSPHILYKMIQKYERMSGQKPKEYSSPIDKEDHPELDTSEYIDLEGIKIYQSMIGALKCVMTLRRFDVLEALLMMCGFCVMSRLGHLDRLERIYGCLKRHPGIQNHEAIKIPETYILLHRPRDTH
jgi:hypothetical protein